MIRPVTLNIIHDVTNQLYDFFAELSPANQDGIEVAYLVSDSYF